MKKLIVSVLAIASMVACMNEETVRVQDGNPIAFENTYVQNATRSNDPSTTTKNIQEFYVWAYMNEVGGVVFDNETVSRSGDDWTYTNTQYWMPGHNYYFAAFAGDRTAIETLPKEMYEYGLGLVKFTNVDGTNDILYSEAVVEGAAVDQAPVALTFKHLLSKVKFTFKNGFQNDNNKVVVKNITMDVAETAYVDLSADADFTKPESVLPWTNLDGTTKLKFGGVNKLDIGVSEAAENERLTIPADANYEYVIKFDVEVYNGSVLGLQKPMEVKLSGLELVAGRAYNLMATIDQENLELNKIEFLVEVDEWIEQDVDGGAVEGEVRFVSTIDELQTILNAATGDLSVVLGADLTGNVNVPELANATIAINGNGHTFDGCFLINGKSTYANATTVFENINFATADNSAFIGSGDAFIYCGEHNGTNLRYPDNVTVKNCTFTAAAADTVVGIKFWSLNGNLVVENCEANNMHSLMQLTSCGEANVLVENVTIANCKNGISLQYAGNNVIRNSNIVAREYGIRADGCAATTSIENSTIEAKQPVIVRKVTAAGYTVNVDDASVLKTAEAYHVIFTQKSDDVEYVAPTVDFTFNGPAKYVVFPYIQNAVAVATEAELSDAVKNAVAGDAVVVAEGTYGKFPSVGNKNLTIICHDVVFEGNSKLNIGGSTVIGATFSNPSGSSVDQTINGVFKDCTFTGSNALRNAYVGETCVFENCVFDGGVYGIHFDGGASKEVTFRNCTISGFNALAAAIGMATFDGCTFKSNGRSGYNGVNLWGSAKLIDCEFTFNGSCGNEWIDFIGADKTYEVTNCTVNGVAYTADNYTQFPDIFSRNHATVKINGVNRAL